MKVYHAHTSTVSHFFLPLQVGIIVGVSFFSFPGREPVPLNHAYHLEPWGIREFGETVSWKELQISCEMSQSSHE